VTHPLAWLSPTAMALHCFSFNTLCLWCLVLPCVTLSSLIPVYQPGFAPPAVTDNCGAG
jgi:hypothetical protein